MADISASSLFMTGYQWLTSLAAPRPAVVNASIIPKQYLMVSFLVCSTAAFRELVSLSILISSSFALSRNACNSSRMRPFSRFRSSLWLAVSLSISYLQQHQDMLVVLSHFMTYTASPRLARCYGNLTLLIKMAFTSTGCTSLLGTGQIWQTVLWNMKLFIVWLNLSKTMWGT